MKHTSPHPLVEVTLLKAKLIVPPPVPLWVDREPDKTAVSFVVRGAYKGTLRGKNRIKHLPYSQRQTTNRPVMYLYRL